MHSEGVLVTKGKNSAQGNAAVTFFFLPVRKVELNKNVVTA